MENSLKGLLLAAGTIITCIVIGLGFYISREARDTASNGAGQISKLNAEFNESDKLMYDNITVSGSEVLNVINKYKNDDIGIIVSTRKTPNTYYIHTLSTASIDGQTVYTLGAKSSNNVKSAQDINNHLYINPNGQFMGEILRDNNNVVIGISFIQN